MDAIPPHDFFVHFPAFCLPALHLNLFASPAPTFYSIPHRHESAVTGGGEGQFPSGCGDWFLRRRGG